MGKGRGANSLPGLPVLFDVGIVQAVMHTDTAICNDWAFIFSLDF